ncbi:formylglycine-generating enzyme family protein [Nostoc sphaeroides]|uniref:Formylglycine-generating enzyme family protein n=1 Tax=Nostoc sphaeroides CCNUC1 TaxID=2653204 RepID=A0A5P8WF33_9NOSO|nr:formylglycine-generating enzyme family protein [Nostoc sphaeroides]QFS51274.1 formylglycine-generating enzyme family protein [Nostoc sphaeroides CCNUC1]
MAQTIIERYRRTGLHFVEDLGNAVQLEMVLIKGGVFTMGAPETEEGSKDYERPQHEVTIQTYFMGKYPVTQAQWKAVAALPQIKRKLEADPSNFKGDQRPVERVSWYDAVEFCDRLSDHTKRQYRLPSEAEWEYACRAGTTSPFHFGETITTDIANYRGTDEESLKWSGSYGRGPKGIYREETTPVGSFEVANAFGLYDMHGNVFEWCLDDWHDNYEDAPTDGSPWLDNKNDNLYQQKGSAVLRGGSWLNFPEDCCSAYRNTDTRDFHIINFGFRIVCAAGRILQ